MKTVRLITDGSCLGNPGPGGWAAILRYGDFKKEMSGADPDTTNNRMEMMAVIEGLAALKEPCKVVVEIDSEYVKNGITTWIHGWKSRGWKTADKKPVKNVDLWQRLEAQAALHHVKWHWVRGHNGDVGNERADALANKGVAQASQRA